MFPLTDDGALCSQPALAPPPRFLSPHLPLRAWPVSSKRTRRRAAAVVYADNSGTDSDDLLQSDTDDENDVLPAYHAAAAEEKAEGELSDGEVEKIVCRRVRKVREGGCGRTPAALAGFARPLLRRPRRLLDQ